MRLSIITINYNNKLGLLHTMTSVIGQSRKEFEWIVIDGGSTDGSRELIEQNARHIAYWCSEKDGGIYNAMNKGIRKASGDYCLFLNSGDCLADSNIVDQVFNHELDKDIVFGYMLDSFAKKSLMDLKTDNLSLVDLLQKSLPHPASFIKRELFAKIGMYDETYKIVSDWKFFLQAIVIENVSLKYIPLAISIFDTSGISSQIKRSKEYQMVLEDLFPPRILKDLPLAVSLSEIYSRAWSKRVYSVLYRIVGLLCSRK